MSSDFLADLRQLRDGLEEMRVGLERPHRAMDASTSESSSDTAVDSTLSDPPPYSPRTSTRPEDQENYRVTFLQGGHNGRPQEWIVRLRDLRRYSGFDWDAVLQRQVAIAGRSPRLTICYLPDEFGHLVDYITAGIYPIFYSPDSGFDVPKYVRVLRCAEYYGVWGLIDWIRAEKYYDVVQKRYQVVAPSPRDLGILDVPGDVTVDFIQDQNKPKSWHRIGREINWRRDLLVEHRDADNRPLLR